jgi:hypothetical protein
MDATLASLWSSMAQDAGVPRPAAAGSWTAALVLILVGPMCRPGHSPRVPVWADTPGERTLAAGWVSAGWGRAILQRTPRGDVGCSGGNRRMTPRRQVAYARSGWRSPACVASKRAVSAAKTRAMSVSVTSKAGLAVGSCRHSTTAPIANTEAACRLRNVATPKLALVAVGHPRHRPMPVQAESGTMSRGLRRGWSRTRWATRRRPGRPQAQTARP